MKSSSLRVRTVLRLTLLFRYPFFHIYNGTADQDMQTSGISFKRSLMDSLSMVTTSLQYKLIICSGWVIANAYVAGISLFSH